MIHATYTSSLERTIRLRTELIDAQLKSKKRTFIKLTIAVIITVIHSLMNTPLSLGQWISQIIGGTAIFYVILYAVERTQNISILKRAFKATPESYWGTVVLDSFPTHLKVQSPNVEQTIQYSDVDSVVRTKSAIHLTTAGGVPFISLSRELPSPFLDIIEQNIASVEQDAAPNLRPR